MKIAVVGAGAIGGWLGARLAISGQDVSIFARGQTRDAIRERGLKLIADGKDFTVGVPASDHARELGTQDLVIVAVKGPALADVALRIAQLLGPETVVLSAMNGIAWWFTSGMPAPLAGATLRSIDPGGAIAASLPPSRTIGCVVHASCSVRAPGEVVHGSGNRLIIGEPLGGSGERLRVVREALAKARFDVDVSERIQKDVWYKLWGNMTMNPISALTGALTNRILDDELVKTFALSVMAEAAEIGRRIGCPIAESGEDRMMVTRKLGAIKTSMLQDAERGRPLEIDALLAAPREIARLVDLHTPYMDALHGLVRLYAEAHASTRDV